VSPGATSSNVSGVVVLSFTCAIPDRQRLMKAYERSPYPPMVRVRFVCMLHVCIRHTCCMLHVCMQHTHLPTHCMYGACALCMDSMQCLRVWYCNACECGTAMPVYGVFGPSERLMKAYGRLPYPPMVRFNVCMLQVGLIHCRAWLSLPTLPTLLHTIHSNSPTTFNPALDAHIPAPPPHPTPAHN
jgi:hypothetical protein